MPDLAFDASRVLKKNYPDYKISKSKNDIIIAEKINRVLNKNENKTEINKKSWYSYFNIFSYF